MIRRLPSLVEVEAERAKRSLSYYIQKAWGIVEPATEYLHNWHIDLISEYLEAVTRGQVRNLIINIPPRCMKSLITSVMWPTWMWTHSPAKRFLTTSYSAELAVRDALKSRRIIQHQWYQDRFGDVFQLAGDQNLKSRYENDKTGFRVAVGVGGGSTGEGGDFLLVDDPLKADDADSDLTRQGVNDWWDGTMSTRGNDPRRVAKVIIMQRLHDDDLSGHVLAKEKDGGEHYEHLCLPMEYEPNRFYSVLQLKDPRKEPGELLWPERFGRDEVEALKANLGARGAAGQLQQRPAPAGGLVYLAEWWEGKNRFDLTDHGLFVASAGRWLSFDTAFKDEEQNDHTAMVVLELAADYRLMVRSVEWKKLQFPQLAREVQDQAARWNYDRKLRGIIIEDKGSGISALQTLRQQAPAEIARLLMEFKPGAASKEARGRQASLWCERGCVLLPHPDDGAPWLYEFEHEHLYKFPGSRFDDPEDAFSQGIIFLEYLLAEGWRARTRMG